MKSIDELIKLEEPALPMIRQWLSSATNHCELLPASTNREDVLLSVQVTTRSVLGALAYETGGILVDYGWIRFLGSGHASLSRTLPEWNFQKSDGCYFIADDAAGGFFAVNGGAFGEDFGKVYYWPADSLDWESTGLGYADFLHWILFSDLDDFYDGIRWSTWRQDISALSGNQCFAFYPPLWTKQGSPDSSMRAMVSIQEAFALKIEVIRQLDAQRT